jgi:hypothetical protein
MAGNAIGTTRSCSVLGLTPSTDYDFRLVAFRGTLDLNAVFGGLSNVATTTTGGDQEPEPDGGPTGDDDDTVQRVPVNLTSGCGCSARRPASTLALVGLATAGLALARRIRSRRADDTQGRRDE